jgi:hypothetical protein
VPVDMVDIEVDMMESKQNSTNSVKRPVSMYEARQLAREQAHTQSLYSMTSNSSSSGSGIQTTMPSIDEVKKRTDQITRRIQELVQAMQDISNNNDEFVPCGERIRIAVVSVIAIFPQVRFLIENFLRIFLNFS